MNRKITVALAAVAGAAAISLTACGPSHHYGSSHHVTLGNAGAYGGTVPASDCAVKLSAKGVTGYLDFHGTVDGLTAGSQCAKLVQEAGKQNHVAVAEVTSIPASFKSVCSATSTKGYTVTVYSDSALGNAAGHQFCKAFTK